MTTNVYQTIETQAGNVILTSIQQPSEEMRNLQDFDWYVERFGLRRGDIITFRKVEITAETETYREYRHGGTGQRQERITSKTQKTVSKETLKLWHTKARGWYWIE